jgi:hypothetical protein
VPVRYQSSSPNELKSLPRVSERLRRALARSISMRTPRVSVLFPREAATLLSRESSSG